MFFPVFFHNRENTDHNSEIEYVIVEKATLSYIPIKTLIGWMKKLRFFYTNMATITPPPSKKKVSLFIIKIYLVIYV